MHNRDSSLVTLMVDLQLRLETTECLAYKFVQRFPDISTNHTDAAIEQPCLLRTIEIQVLSSTLTIDAPVLVFILRMPCSNKFGSRTTDIIDIWISHFFLFHFNWLFINTQTKLITICCQWTLYLFYFSFQTFILPLIHDLS